MLQQRSERYRWNRADREKDLFDWTKKPEILIHEILWCIVGCEGQDIKRLLAGLNSFVKFNDKFKDININELGFTDEEILRCLRTSLLHNSADVRAAGIRSIRHFIKTENHVKCIYQLKLDFLIVRSIDICLENKTERIHALRLIRKLLSFDPQNFSFTLIRCLIAISRDGSDKKSKDIMVKTCLAILTELVILNPELSYRIDLISSLMDSICRYNNPYNILESVLSSYIYLFNNPELRVYTDDGSDLQKFIGIFTDLPYVSWLSHGETVGKTMNSQTCAIEEIELRLKFIKNILVSIFRSWPGLIYVCQTTKNDVLMRRNPATLQQDQHHNSQIKNVQSLNGVQTLVEMMYLPFTETRKHLMEIIFELFYLPLPDWVDDFETALLSTNHLSMQDNWQLYYGFVAAEAKSLLPHISNHRLNFTDNYISLLLYSLISNGLLESLVSIIISLDNMSCSVRATILVGELLHLTNQYLPPEMSQVCQSLSQLMNACISDKMTIKQKTVANTAVSCLSKMHSLKKPMPSRSLFLDLQLTNPSFRSSIYDLPMSKWQLKDFYQKVKPSECNSIASAIKASQVLVTDPSAWDWSLIGFLLKVPSDYMKKLEENSQLFLSRLINFFKPTSKQFSSIDPNVENAKEISLAGLYLIDFLVECDENKSEQFINLLMTDLNFCLSQISIETAPSANSIFGAGNMLTTLSSFYFLYMGKLSQSARGNKLLEKFEIYKYLASLIVVSSNDVYVKLIISSLDYTQDKFSRKLLYQALTCKLDSARLYATNFLLVLLRTELKDFHKWVIKLLVQQLNDESQPVCLSALEILDEACDKQENLVELISLRPNLSNLNYKGILLFSRFVSCEEGFTYLKETNQLNQELERWQKSFFLKYVNIVEEILNETFTYHQKSEDGSYGRRMDKRNFMVKKNAYLPPHLYGQLVIYKEGSKLIASESIVTELINKIKKIVLFDSRNPAEMVVQCAELIDYKELTILQLKASIWACSHIASTELGLELIKDTDFIQILVELAGNCQLLSIRATAFFCMGLISTTEMGSALLYEYDWISLRHNRSEKWPIFKEMIEKNEFFSYPFKQLINREYAASISSVGTKTTDINIAKTLSKHTLTSGIMINSTSSTRSEDEHLSKSLSHIENNKHKSFLKLEQLNENFIQNGNSRLSNKLQVISNQVRPRSSSDCQQKVSFNLSDRKSVTNNQLDEFSNSMNCDLGASCNSTQPSLIEISKQTISTDQFENNHFSDNNHQSSHHLDGSDQGSLDQLTSPVSFCDVENGNLKVNSNHEAKNLCLPARIDEENSTFDIPKENATKFINRKQLQYSQSTRKLRSTYLTNSFHYGPKRKTSEPIGSIDFKTLHSKMIRHSSSSSISHSKQRSLDSNNDDDISLRNSHLNTVNYSTSYPESIKSNSFEYSLPAAHHSRETFRKLSQISNPHSFERNYSLFMNTCLPGHDNGSDCEYLLGLQDDSFEIAMPSTEDTIGYATLKSLQHKKERTNQSLLFNNLFPDFKSDLKDDLLHNKENEIAIEEDDKFNELNGDDELTKEFTNGFRLSSISGRGDDYRFKSESYMSICLPDNLSLIFDLESHKRSFRNQQRITNLQRKIFDDRYSTTSRVDVDVNLGFKLHRKHLCLLGDNHKTPLIEHFNLDRSKKDKRTISMTESNLDEEDRIEIKREIINLVCRLSSCIFVQKTEMDLLSLKQTFPNIFHDVCMYSEICLHISNYSFTLHSRRFLQELFLDADFEQLHVDARNIFTNKIPINNANS